MERFSDQVAVISGGADGLGKGIALRLASESARLALFDINERLLEQTVAQFQTQGFIVKGYRVDISSEEEVSKAFARVEAEFGKVDMMVNSAGIVGPTSTRITEYSVEAYDRIYGINLRGSFLMTKYAIKAMERRLGARSLHCPVCRAEVEDDYLVCPVCTTKLRQACTTCSRPLEPAWQVCPYCETPIVTDEAPVVPAPKPGRRRTPRPAGTAGE